MSAPLILRLLCERFGERRNPEEFREFVRSLPGPLLYDIREQALCDFLAGNMEELGDMRLEAAGVHPFGWSSLPPYQSLFRLGLAIASGEITEEMLKEPETTAAN